VLWGLQSIAMIKLNDRLFSVSIVLLMLLAILLTLGHGFYHVFFGNSLIGLVSLIACAFMGMALWKTLSDCVALPFIYGFFIFTTFALFLTSYYYGVRGLVLLFPLGLLV